MQATTTLGPSSGLRAKAGRMWETMPNPGRMAMYTSGCPKNQNRCCQSSGEPPECGCSRSLTTSPPGMKKLVPATRSRMSRMQAGSSTENAMRPITEVMNHAQVENGMRIRVMPLVRRSSVVAMKLSAAQQLADAEDGDGDGPQRLPSRPAPARRPCRRR